MKLIAILEGDARFVGDDFVFAWLLKKQNIAEWYAGQPLKTRPGSEKVLN